MSRVHIVFNDFMRVAVFFYNTVGMQAYQPSGDHVSSSRWIYLTFILCVSNLAFVNGLELTFALQAFKKNEEFIEGTMMLNYLGYSIVSYAKMVAVWRQKPKLSAFMRDLESIFPSNQLSEQRNYRVEYYLHHSRLVMKVLGGLYILLVSTFNIYPLVSYFIERWLLFQSDTERRMAFVPTAPWNWHDSWIKYLLFYFMQCLAGYTATAGHISTDLLIYSIATQVIMHFDWLARTLEKYEVQARRVPDVQKKDLQFLQRMVIYHNKLLRLTNVMNQVFGVPLLLNFFLSSVLVCFLGFLMTVGVNMELKFKLFVFFCSCMSEIYLLCYYSQLLIDMSGNVALATYNMDWSEAHPNFRKMLILMAQRGQKTVHLKATVFLDVSMCTMTDFMQMSYKFFALLRTIYRP